MAAGNIWFTSDLHLGHSNIIKYCNRPFGSADEMNQRLIDWHNELVKPNDKVYNLGDVVVNKRYLSLARAFNGHKRLITGNHDIYPTKEYMDAGFEEVKGMRVMAGMMFTHIPTHPNSLGRFGCCVHGHLHDKTVQWESDYEHKMVDDPRYLNLCVEHTNYRPVALEEVVATMTARLGTDYLKNASINAWKG